MKNTAFFLKNLFMYGCFLLSMNFVSANFHIVEVMPNTTDDKNLEYVTIQNASSDWLSLSGYVLSDKKKDFLFDSDIFLGSGEKRSFFRPETKLVLNNSDEKLSLKNPAGDVVSEIEYTSSVKSIALVFKHAEVGTLDMHADVGGNTQNNSHTGSESSENNSHEFQIQLEFQRPSYVSQSGSTNVYICDSSKEECKINFSLEKSFGGDFPKKDYYCLNDFGGYSPDETQKCNPNTVIFPEGENRVIFKVFRKKDDTLIGEKEIIISYDTTQIAEGENQIKEYGDSPKLALRFSDIEVQSGLSGISDNFYCLRDPCKINLRYTKTHKNEECLWDFGPGSFSDMKTQKRCNPGYVDIPKGVFSLSLTIFEKQYPSNRKKKTFFVHNSLVSSSIKEVVKEQEISTTMKTSQKDSRTSTGIIKQHSEKPILKTEIELQGKLGKEKTFSGSVLRCQGVSKCYLNFIASGFLDSKIYSYKWLNNGKVFSEKYNPGGEWFETGKHKIELKVFQDEILLSKAEYVALVREEKLLTSDAGKTVKPLMKKEKPIKKDFTQSYLPLKYDGLRISGKAPVGSMVKVFVGERLLGSSIVSKKGKYRIVTKNIQAGNHHFQTRLIAPSGEEQIYENSGKYTLLQEKRAFWFIPKKVSKKSESKKKTPKHAIPELIVLTDAVNDNITKDASLNLFQRVFLSLVLTIVMFVVVLHIFFLHAKGIMGSSLLNLYNLRFSTKQRVNLLVG